MASSALHDWYERLRMTADELRTRFQEECGVKSRTISGPSVRRARSLRLSDLEPRLLFSATPIDPAFLDGADQVATVLQVDLQPSTRSEQQQSTNLFDQSSEQSTSEIIVIDAAVPELQSLLDDLAANRPGAEVFVINDQEDGVQQMTRILEGRSGVSGIHLITHGENGSIRLGNTWLNAGNLDAYAGEIASWSHALTSDADLLLYGCDLAASESGRTLLSALSVLTEADVAASDDDTGHARYGADWELEYQTGAIETNIATSEKFQESWQRKLATISVTTTADETSANGQTSLREAIQAATAGDTILLSSGTYNLTIDSLDIDKDLTIIGTDARSTTIDASALNKRAITLKNDAVVTISRMTIQGGNENNGGGIFVDTDNTLYLSDAVLRSNTSNMGGAIHVHGTAHLDRVLLHNNTATNEGGAIHFHNDGSGSLTNVTVSGNTASNNGGGVYADGDITIVNSTITLNSGQQGGGVYSRDGFVAISNTIVANNNGIGSHVDVSGNFISDGTNLIKNGAASAFADDLTGVDPNLGSLTNNGGQTDTHVLLAGSPAIEGGSVVMTNTVDARGFLRGETSDIGSTQFTVPTLTSTSEQIVNTQTGLGANTNSQSRGSTSAIATDEAGNYVVVWTSPGGQDGSGDGVYGQRFNASGQKIGSEFRINSSTTGDQKWASVAMNNSGMFVVTWTTTDSVTADTQVFARRYHASGLALGDEFRISDETAGQHYSSSIAIADDGRFAVVWATRPTSSSTGLYLRTFDSSGNEVGSTQTLDTRTGDIFGIKMPAISMIGDGRFVVAWERTGDVYVQRFTALGTTVASNIKVSEASGLDGSSQPAVAMANDGTFVVAFTDGVFERDINVQRFDAAGNETGGRILVNASSTDGIQSAPSIAMDNNGNFIVAWSGQGPGDNNGVFFQKFQSDGTSVDAITRINDVTAGSQTHVSLAMLNPDNLVVTWTGTEVFARQFGTASVVDTNQSPIGVNDSYEVNKNSTLNSASSWFDNDWQYRRTLSFDNSEQSENLTDFPVLIRLDASRIEYAQTQNAGQDLRFVDQDGNLLAHEIESWNEAGSSYVWVKVPQIPAGSTTSSILMYYGNASASDGQNAASVWAGNTRAVYHLHDDFLDSTSNNSDGTNSGSLDSKGRYGDGQLFDGVNDLITISSATSINNVFSTGGTISVWFNPTSWGENQYGRLLDKSSGTSPSPNGWSLQLDGANESLLFEVGFTGGTGRWRAEVGAVKLNEWQNVTVVYDGSSNTNNPQIYINGIQQTLIEANTPTGVIHSDVGLALTIGNYQDQTRTFDGKIDEARVLNGTVSADWVAAKILSGRDQFVNFGTQQTVAGVLGNDIEPDRSPLTATLVGGDPVNAKSFSFNSDGSFVYTPNDNFFGVDTFTYQANDGDLDSNLVTVTITVNNVNSAPTLALTPTITSTPENTNTTTSIKVADVTISDDGLGTNHLSLTGADASLFELAAGGTELHLKAGVVLDFETKPVLDVNVVVDDPAIGGAAEDTEAYSLSITDSNEAPTLTVTPVVVSMPENTNTTTSIKVADVSIDDDGLGSNNLTLTGADAGMFELLAGGSELHLRAGVTLDFETNPVLDVNVVVDDPAIGGAAEDTESYSLSITDSNEAPTLSVTPVVVSMPENTNTSTSIKVADVNVTDDALGTNSLLLTGADASLFELAAGGTELHLIAGVVLDFETKPVLDVNVVVDDPAIGGAAEDTEAYLLAITDSNEAPTLTVTPVVISMPENTNTTSSIKVADVSIDDDGLGTNSLTLTGADAGMFELLAGGSELHLRAGVTLDFETNPVLNVSVQLDDPTIGSTVEDTDSFMITIVDANDLATGIPEIQGTLVVGQTLTVETSSIADQDGLGAFEYQWMRGADIIVGAESAVYVLTSADEGRVMRVAIRFEDGGGHTEGPLVSTPTMVIAAANIAPTLDDYITSTRSNEAKVLPASVFTSLAADADGQPLSAILVAPPLVGTLDLLPSGSFTYTPPVDFVGRVTFQWKATDGDLDSNVATVTIDVIPTIPIAVLPPSTPSDGVGNKDAVSNDKSDSSSRQANEDVKETGTDDATETSGQTDDSARAALLPGSNRESSTGQTLSDEATQVAIVAELASKNSSASVISPIGTSETLIAQLSDSFVQRTERASRELTDDLDGTSGFIDDSQTRSLVMADYALMTRPGEMWEQLDNYQQNINSRIQGDLIVVGSAGAAASSFTVGIVAWAMRSGFLVSGLIAHMPAWSGVDPLLIMQGVTGGSAAGSAGNETLEQLMDRQNKQVEGVEE